MAETTSLVPVNLTNGMLRQLGLLVGIAASVAVGVAVVMWSQTPNYSLLYGSLSDLDMSEVMDTLQSAKIPFQLDHKSGAVLVPSDKVYEARIKLAAAGLPKTASTGFELLEKEPGFGSSQFIEQARYQRALEGELSRSIATLSNVRGARVHLAIPKQSVFSRDKKDPSASVLVDIYPGRMLEEGQVAAIVHLVAASIPNLPMTGVTVVDQRGRLLTGPEGSKQMMETAWRFDYARRVEQSYIDRIKDILTPIVGSDGVKAQVTADLDFTQTEQTSESFNPDLPSVRSEQLMEELRSGSVDGGIPGALSNQPPAQATVPETTDAQPGTGAAGQPVPPRNARKQQTRNYELDKTISHSRMATGSLRRLSVAVVVNNRVALDKEGKEVRTEISPEELNRITALVKEAIGFNPARGDTVNVINADFSTPPPPEPLPDLPLWQKPWFWDVVKQVLGGAIALFIALGVLRPVLRNLVKKEEEALTLPGPVTDKALPPGTGQALPSTGGNASQLSGPFGAGRTGAPSDLLSSIPEIGDLEAVKTYAKQEPKMAAQVIKGWLGSE